MAFWAASDWSCLYDLELRFREVPGRAGLNLDEVPAKLSLDRLADFTDGELESGFLERRHHAPVAEGA